MNGLADRARRGPAITTTRSCPTQELIADINITPFTDVLLALLIIFMILAAITTPPGFQKQVPDRAAARKSLTLPHRPILVEVTSADRITLDGATAPFARLYLMMAAAIARHQRLGESIHIELLTGVGTSYNAVIKILDAARQAGDEDVGFVIQ